MANRGKKTGLVVQDGEMIPGDGSPVLTLESTEPEKGVYRLVARTARFLRCGCPSVQWLVATKGFFELGKSSEEIMKEKVGQALNELRQHGEKFELKLPESLWLAGSVITVTLTVAPEIVVTTFGEVPEGRGFLVTRPIRPGGPSQEFRCVRRDTSPEPSGVVLEGEKRGFRLFLPLDCSVKLIVE